MASNKRILVTGAAGFIGSHLCERLAGAGHTVLGVDCRTDYYTTALKELNSESLRDSGVQLDSSDLATDDLGALMGDVEYVFHLAAQPGISTPFDAYLRNNLVATHRLLEAAMATTTFAGISQYLHVLGLWR